MKMIAPSMDSSSAGVLKIPRLMINVVAPAGGCGLFVQVSTSVSVRPIAPRQPHG